MFITVFLPFILFFSGASGVSVGKASSEPRKPLNIRENIPITPSIISRKSITKDQLPTLNAELLSSSSKPGTSIDFSVFNFGPKSSAAAKKESPIPIDTAKSSSEFSKSLDLARDPKTSAEELRKMLQRLDGMLEKAKRYGGHKVTNMESDIFHPQLRLRGKMVRVNAEKMLAALLENPKIRDITNRDGLIISVLEGLSPKARESFLTNNVEIRKHPDILFKFVKDSINNRVDLDMVLKLLPFVKSEIGYLKARLSPADPSKYTRQLLLAMEKQASPASSGPYR